MSLKFGASSAALAFGTTKGLTFGGGGLNPAVYIDFTQGVLPSANYTYSNPTQKTITDATGNITYAPNNLFLNSSALVTQTISSGIAVGVNYLVTVTGTGSVTLSGGATGTASAGSPLKVTATTGSITFTVSGTLGLSSFSAVTYETSPRPGDQFVTASAAYYGPAIDYDPVTHAPLGLRIEEQRKNYVFNSSAITTGPWAPVNTPAAAQTTTAPDGSLAWNITDTGVANGYYQPVTTSISTTYVMSVFVKKVSGSGTLVQIGSDTALWGTGTQLACAQFNLDTQAFSAIQAGVTSTGYVSVGNGWYRIWIVATTSSSGTIRNVNNYIMSLGTVAFWGHQLEAGSFPTSYIPTGSAAATRAADVVALQGPALTAVQSTPGAVVMETGAFANLAGGTALLSVGGSNLLQEAGSGNQVGTYNGSTSLAQASWGGTYASIVRSGIAWNAAGRTVGAGGAVTASDANVVGTGVAASYLLSVGGSSSFGDGYIRKLAIYNTALTSSQLQARTVLGAPF